MLVDFVIQTRIPISLQQLEKFAGTYIGRRVLPELHWSPILMVIHDLVSERRCKPCVWISNKGNTGPFWTREHCLRLFEGICSDVSENPGSMDICAQVAIRPHHPVWENQHERLLSVSSSAIPKQKV
jgi:hypothetical protein